MTAVQAEAEIDLDALDDHAFRMEVRRWIEANYPADLRYPKRRLMWDEVKDWYMTLSRKGWLAPGWPKAHGGMGLPGHRQAIYLEECERWGVARAPDMGIILLGPLIIHFGTDEQKAAYLPKILSGEHVWCQGYSEPGAGSDLAGLRTEAVLDGDEYVVNGHKIWTTMAHQANMIFMLVRTDKEAKKQEGISFLLAPMDTPGITVRTIRNLCGHDEFCEVFLDDVRVPKDNMIGAPNTGWTMAKALLGFERIFIGSPKLAQSAFKRLTALAEARDLFAQPVFNERYTALRMDLADLSAAYARFLDVLRRGEQLGPEVSMLKIGVTEAYQRITDLMLDVAGESAGMPVDLPAEGGGVDVTAHFFNARPATIYGGTNEIQRNILAKAVLRLPG